MNDDHYLLYIGILMIPTCITQIIPILYGKNTAPYLSFLFSIFCNVGFGFLISALFDHLNDPFAYYKSEYAIIMAIFFLIFGFFPLFHRLAENPSSFDENYLLAWEEINTKIMSHRELIDTLGNNRTLPPKICVKSTAYHTMVIKRQIREFVTYRNSTEFKYNSWQEEGKFIRILPYATILHFFVSCEFIFDKEAEYELSNLHELMFNDAKNHDSNVKVENKFKVPGMKASFCGTSHAADDKINNLVIFLCSCKGRLLYVFLTMIGYKSVIDAIWFSHGQILHIKLVKRISMKSKISKESTSIINNDNVGLRAGYGEKDYSEMNKVFCVKSRAEADLQEEMIFQPLLSSSEHVNKPSQHPKSCIMDLSQFSDNIKFVDNNREHFEIC